MATAPASKHPQTTRIAIIGSGFGGLAAALRLQAAGYSTVIFEARDKPGGRAYVYERDGFTFDGGPTVITAPVAFEELFAVAGKHLEDYVEFIPVQPFYRLVWDDGDTFDYVGDSEQMLEQIRQRDPNDAKGYLDFVECSRKVFKRGYDELAATPFLHFTDMLGVAPALAQLRADRSVYDKILAALERHMPDLRKHVVVKHFIAPKDFERDLAAYHGSAFSLAPTLIQSAWFRPHNRDPHIPGLYIVGAGTHPGAGLPGVVASAKATASLVVKVKDYALSER